MSDILNRLAICVELGKINRTFPFPPFLKGQDGADELCKLALEEGIRPQVILNQGLIPGMSRIGDKYSRGEAFVPEMLISAKAMTAAMRHLKPFFANGEIRRKGIFVIGTVTGDLHDIGKNIVAMTIEGAGWEVIDLGVDVSRERFVEAIDKYPACIVGLSALLTTTMVNMEAIVREIKTKYPNKVIMVGGAPVSQEFCDRIGASCYFPDPQGAVEFLEQLA